MRIKAQPSLQRLSKKGEAQARQREALRRRFMIRVGNILVPVDFSEPSKIAVNYGLSFALEFDSRLILAHIAPFDPVAYEQAKADLLELIPVDCRERLNFEIIVKA